jgi:Tfp pilus assembly protein PilP
MNQELDLQKIWRQVRSYAVGVDWLFFGMIALVGVNILFGLYFAWTVFTQPDFFTKYELSPSQSIVQRAKQLEPVPPMEEIQIEQPARSNDLPTRYVKLSQSSLFAPVGVRLRAEEPTEADTSPDPKQLPPIEGYQIVGRISGQGKDKVSMLKRISDGKTFIAREGEYLQDTDIKVTTVTDTVVMLRQPSHKPTSFRFKTDRIEQNIKGNIRLH